jgi:hypothetical protein
VWSCSHPSSRDLLLAQPSFSTILFRSLRVPPAVLCARLTHPPVHFGPGIAGEADLTSSFTETPLRGPSPLPSVAPRVIDVAPARRDVY